VRPAILSPPDQPLHARFWGTGFGSVEGRGFRPQPRPSLTETSQAPTLTASWQAAATSAVMCCRSSPQRAFVCAVSSGTVAPVTPAMSAETSISMHLRWQPEVGGSDDPGPIARTFVRWHRTQTCPLRIALTIARRSGPWIYHASQRLSRAGRRPMYPYLKGSVERSRRGSGGVGLPAVAKATSSG
jgi:hypothetical protein